MSRLLGSVVLIEGITHIEDLPLSDFIKTVENLKDQVVTEKLDGANLWFGVDDKGFFTSREGKSKKTSRFYSVEDYPMVAAYNGFRAAHLALEKEKTIILRTLTPGDIVEVEVIFGRQPNTVIYGADGKNYIVILRGVGTDPKKVDELSKKLNGKSVTVKSTVISSPDGNKLDFNDESITWSFTHVSPIDSAKIDTSEVKDLLDGLKKFLSSKNQNFSKYTNREIADIKLGSIPKDEREDLKIERDNVNTTIMNDYKLPIKEMLLNNFVRKVKPNLQTKELEPSEDIGVEGVVVSDKESGQQTKIVDKDVFTAINTFNNSIRSNISGVVRTDNQDAPIELRGGAFGQAKIRIANLLGVKELAVSSTTKKIIKKFQGTTPVETAANLATSLHIENLPSIRTKISAILKNAVEEVDEVLEKFKNEAGEYRLRLKTGKEIGITQEVMKRNLTAFAETKRDIAQINSAVLKSQTPTDLVLALYGRTIESLFNGSDDVKESFNLIKSFEDAGAGAVGAAAVGGGGEATPTTTASDVAAFAMPVFRGSKQIIKRTRTYTKKKFKMQKESLLRVAEADIANQFATDVDDSAAAQKDVEFKQLRNTVNVGDNVTSSDVNRYLDRAHELNNQVDTVAYGLELDDGNVVKVYVNANQDEGFADALSKMLGEYDDIEQVIDLLADKFDVVDVEWPKSMAQSSPGDQDVLPQEPPSEVSPVIDLGDAETTDIVPSTDADEMTDNQSSDSQAVSPAIDGNSDENPDSEEAKELTIDNTFYGDGDEGSEDATTPAEADADSSTGESEDSASDENSGAGEEGGKGGAEVGETPSSDEGTGAEDDEGESSSDDDSGTTPPDDTPPGGKKKKKKKTDDDETDDEPSDTPAKTEESLSYGQRVKQRILSEDRLPPYIEGDTEDAAADIDPHDALPDALKKLLTYFPKKGDKAIVALMYALGAPVDVLNVKRSDLKSSITDLGVGVRYMSDAQFRSRVKKLTDALLMSMESTSVTNALEDQMGATLYKVALEILLRCGLSDSIQRIARNSLRNGIKSRIKIALKSPHVRQYLRQVASLLDIDPMTGDLEEGVKWGLFVDGKLKFSSSEKNEVELMKEQFSNSSIKPIKE